MRESLRILEENTLFRSEIDRLKKSLESAERREAIIRADRETLEGAVEILEEAKDAAERRAEELLEEQNRLKADANSDALEITSLEEKVDRERRRADEAEGRERNVWGLIVEMRGALNAYADEHDPGPSRTALWCFGQIMDLAIEQACEALAASRSGPTDSERLDFLEKHTVFALNENGAVYCEFNQRDSRHIRRQIDLAIATRAAKISSPTPSPAEED